VVLTGWLTTVHENARSALECGSLLPLSSGPACWPCGGCCSSEDASKLARQKRQQVLLLTRILVLRQLRLCRRILRKGSAFPTVALFSLDARRGYASPVEAEPQPKNRNEI
jgi:hypothetical protein